MSTNSNLEILLKTLSDYACVPVQSIDLDAPFSDFGIDSLDTERLTILVEDQFQIELPTPGIAACPTPRHLLLLIDSLLETAAS